MCVYMYYKLDMCVIICLYIYIYICVCVRVCDYICCVYIYIYVCVSFISTYICCLYIYIVYIYIVYVVIPARIPSMYQICLFKSDSYSTRKKKENLPKIEKCKYERPMNAILYPLGAE